MMVALILLGCKNIENEKNHSSSNEYEYELFFNEEDNIYHLQKYKIGDSIPVDTVFYYKDSLMKNLIEINTLIYKGSFQIVNEAIHYTKEGSIDYNHSYFFRLNRTNNEIDLKVSSFLNDTMFLIIGDIDTSFEITGKVDTFAITNNKEINLIMKDYYYRGWISMMKEIDTPDSVKEQGLITMRGKDLYIPSKFLKPQ